MKKRLAILFLLSTALLCGFWLGQAACPENFQLRGKLIFDPAQVPSADYEVGDFIIKWRTENGGQLTIESKDHPGFALWQTIPGEAFVMAAQSNTEVTEIRGMFKFYENYINVCQNQKIDFIEAGQAPSGILFFHVNGTLECSSKKQASYTFGWYGWGTQITVQGETLTNTFLTYATSNNEHFFGFGEQFTYFDMKGKRVPVWVSEQGVGRGEEPITTAANITNGGAGGNSFTTYAPMPFFISNKMYSFVYSWPEYLIFDFTNSKRVQIISSDTFFNAEFRFGKSPTELIGIHTQYGRLNWLLAGESTGRMALLPEWIYKSAIVGMQGGTDKVHEIYAKLKERNTPITAFWLQDWVGQRTTSFGKQLWWNWEVDYDRYPNWDEMVADLNNDGIEVMVYTSPYLADIGDLKPNMRRNLFQEAAKKGYLVKNAEGEPYLVLNTDFYFGMVDLTNPDAWKWYKNVL